MRRGLAVVLASAIAVAGLVGFEPAPALAPAAAAPALANVTGNDFRADYIISDANFFDYGSMSQADIQAFIDAKVPTCRASNGVPCLESYRQDTSNRAAVSAAHCSAYQGAPGELASTIIYKVAQACRISPKVLLVLIQKEQSLVTASNPNERQYRVATGYGCPDTAPCDEQFYGFFNQVYKAAWQFRTYTTKPTEWRYRIGNVAVQFHPNASCGAPVVNIKNQATANLYNYTPYQPNAAALSNLGGTGDGCSSYGNRNFWKYYADWFGDPVGNSSPFGIIDYVKGGPGALEIGGWTLDPDTNDSVKVHVYIDGGFYGEVLADGERPDFVAAFPGRGTAHGIRITVPNPAPGSHQVCLYAINISFGGNSMLGCRTAAGGSGSPLAVIDSLSAVPGSITVTGWALDPDSAGPVDVRITRAGSLVTTVSADGVKEGLERSFPGYGDNHLYTATLTGLAGGAHTVCIQSVNVGAGSTTGAICRTVVIPSGSPLGVIDAATGAPGSISLNGWMLDPDTTGPIAVRVLVDGVEKSMITADGAKTGLDGSFPGYGDAHGYVTTVTGIDGGTHQVCIVGVNVRGGSDTRVCRNVTMPTGSPLGVIDTATTSIGQIAVTGWMLDWDTIGAVDLQVIVDNQVRTTLVADAVKAGLGQSFPGYGDLHGYAGVVAGVGPGKHQVCVVGLNVGGGAGSSRICTVVQMPTGSPFGVIDSTVPGTGSIDVAGWAIDPDVATPILVAIRVDNIQVAVLTADGVKPTLGTTFPGYGDSHLFSGSITGISRGRHEICGYALNVEGGTADGYLGCRTVTVG